MPLKEHVAGVVKHVRAFCAGSGVRSELANALEQAAALHDLGKCDMRFQALLGARMDDGPDAMLAKSAGGLSKAERDRRRRVADYPPNARHELWSVALAEKSKLIKGSPFRDLILHLIGTHHGYGRPFAPAWEEQESIEVVSANGELLKATGTNVRDLWSLGSGWVDRFARLNRTYGYWGLAYLEAILRRADCVQSREEQEARAMSSIELTGLRAGVPIGAMAAFGVLRIATLAGSMGKCRLRWTSGPGGYYPVLETETETSADDLVAFLMESVREVQDREALKWTEQLKGETPEKFRQIADGVFQKTSADDRAEMEWMSAIANEMIADDGKIEPTPFDMSVARQKFPGDALRLASLLGTSDRGRRQKGSREEFREALFGPWRYEDDQHSFGSGSLHRETGRLYL